MNEVLEAILNLETALGFVATGVVIEIYRYFSREGPYKNVKDNLYRDDSRYKN